MLTAGAWPQKPRYDLRSHAVHTSRSDTYISGGSTVAAGCFDRLVAAVARIRTITVAKGQLALLAKFITRLLPLFGPHVTLQTVSTSHLMRAAATLAPI